MIIFTPIYGAIMGVIFNRLDRIIPTFICAKDSEAYKEARESGYRIKLIKPQEQLAAVDTDNSTSDGYALAIFAYDQEIHSLLNSLREDGYNIKSLNSMDSIDEAAVLAADLTLLFMTPAVAGNGKFMSALRSAASQGAPLLIVYWSLDPDGLSTDIARSIGLL